MQVSSGNYITQNRIFSGTGMIVGVSLPNYEDSFVYTKTKTKTSDSEYRKAIIEQAIKDQAAGKFQGDSEGFNELQKKYVSEVSPDRKGIIATGLQKAARNNVAVAKPIDVIELLFNGEIKYQESGKTVKYAEFRDSNGEVVATYSNGGWTMLNTKAETARQMEMCSIYNEAWRAAAQASQSSCEVIDGYMVGVEKSERMFNVLA